MQTGHRLRTKNNALSEIACRAAEKVSTTAAVGGQWANVYFKKTVDTTAEGIRRLTGSSLAVRQTATL